MPKGFLSHRSAGDSMRPSARDWNAIVDAVKLVRTRFMANTGMKEGSVSPSSILNAPIRVKNTTVYQWDSFSIVKLGDPIVAPTTALRRFRWKLTMEAEAPGDDEPVVVVTTEIIRSGKVGYAMAAGVVPCLIDVQNEADEYVTTVEGDWQKFKSATPSGCGRILYKEAGTGTKNGLVLIPSISKQVGQKIYFGKVTVEITARSGTTPGYGEVDEYELATGPPSLTSKGLDDVTVWNVWDATIAVDTWVAYLEDENGEYILLAADCP